MTRSSYVIKVVSIIEERCGPYAMPEMLDCFDDIVEVCFMRNATPEEAASKILRSKDISDMEHQDLKGV